MSEHYLDLLTSIEAIQRPERTYETALEFMQAWELMSDRGRPVSPIHGRAVRLASARAACLSMALELALKCLIALEKKEPVPSHSFARLLRQLSGRTQDRIASAVQSGPSTATSVAAALRKCEGTLERWRYSFEHRDLDFFEGDLASISKASLSIAAQDLVAWRSKSHPVSVRRPASFSAKQATEILVHALDSLVEQDSDLPVDVSERALTHRFAFHLEREVHRLSPSSLGAGTKPSELHVDCEYNRIGGSIKRLSHSADLTGDHQSSSSVPSQGSTPLRVYPDIVVHRRGAEGPNLMVIEVKRGNASEPSIERDRLRLKHFRSVLGYQHAFLVIFDWPTFKFQRVGSDRAQSRP